MTSVQQVKYQGAVAEPYHPKLSIPDINKWKWILTALYNYWKDQEVCIC